VVLLVKRTYGDIQRTFALTFGYAKPLFNEDVIEEQFGLKIVLNTVKADDIRKISKLNIGGNQKQSQEQMPKAAKISDFGFNVTSDLMKTVTATCSDQKFENAVITGGDIFSITVDRKIDTIEDFLDHCYHRFTATSYRENFEWIDNIKAVKNKELIEELDNQVINNIISHSLENICLAVPEVINWEQVKCFKYSGSREEYHDIDINVFLASCENLEDLSMSKLKNKSIKAISAENENQVLYNWSAQKCLIAEIEYEDNSYCLNNSKWYQIDHSFETQIKDEYLTIPIYETELLKHKSNGSETYTENEYNEELAERLGAALIHKIGEIPFGGGKGNKIEVCDILTKNKDLMHIKKSGGSSLLSHLFNQATVSGEALLDTEFRRRYNTKLQEKGLDSYIDNAFASLNTSRLSSSAFANFSTSSFFSVCFCFVAVSPKVIWFGKDSIKDLKSVMTAESSPNFLTLSNSCKTERIMFLFAGINLPVSICLSIKSSNSLFFMAILMSFNSFSISSLPCAFSLNVATSSVKEDIFSFNDLIVSSFLLFSLKFAICSSNVAIWFFKSWISSSESSENS